MGKAREKFRIDLTSTAQPFRHYFSLCVGGGRAALGLRRDWQDHLRRCREELGFRYVRLLGLLDDDMGVCTGAPEHPEHHFHNVDLLFDFLLGMGMRPFVSLGFMPWALASGAQTCAHHRANVTPPRDPGQWENLLRDLMLHLAGRYGGEEVAEWFFEVWNEPNRRRFWSGTREQYFELYRRAARAIKAVNEGFRVGGPATARDDWIEEFLAYCAANGVTPDFVTTHHYATDAAPADDLDLEERLAAAPPGILTRWAQDTKEFAGDLPLHYSAWGSSSGCRQPVHDGPYAAAFALKTVADNDGLVEGYAWRAFSDVFDEEGTQSGPFHGGPGLLTLHGVAKPAYHAFRFLHELGNERLPVDGPEDGPVGVLATGRGAGAHVLAWHLRLPGGDAVAAQVDLAVRGAEGGMTGTIEHVDARHANARAVWEDMGRPRYASADQVAGLRAAAAVRSEALELWTRDGEHVAQFALPPGAVARVTLSAE